MSRPHALGGGELRGSRLMRMVYLDEAGTGGSIAKEPNIVMAGVIVHADAQWKAAETYLSAMADDFALPQDRAGFVFHASSLAGADPAFRERYPEQKRLYFLQALCEIPSKFRFPISLGSHSRARGQQLFPGRSHDELIAHGLCYAALDAAIGVEQFMRGLEDEVAVLIFEQNGKKDAVIRKSLNLMRSVHVVDWERENPEARLKSFTKIIDTPHFADKSDTSLLQIADAAAHVLTRKLRGATYNKKCFHFLKDNLIRYPATWRDEIAASRA